MIRKTASMAEDRPRLSIEDALKQADSHAFTVADAEKLASQTGDAEFKIL